MSRPPIVAIFAFLLFASHVEADFYRFTDEDGCVRYTDDFGKIPEARRPDAGAYLIYETNAASDESDRASSKQAGKTIETEPSGEIESDSDDTGFDGEGKSDKFEGESDEHGLEAAYESLRKRQDELAREYEEIMKERERLNQDEGESPPAQIDDRNAKVLEFNEKVKIYQEKKEAFEKQRAEYNAKAVEEMERTLKEHKLRESEESVDQ